jgi:hypothetical protein
MWIEGKWMELEIIMLSKISQVQKSKHHISSFICVIYTKKNDLR